MTAGAELVDVVDDTDRVIQVVTRAEMRAGRLLHRSVAIAVRSTTGQLLIHRRSDAKDLWPGRWDIAVGGVVASGEGYDAAAVRELAEEIGVRGVELAPLGTGRYADDDVALLAQCYAVVHDGPFAFADGEVVEAKWVALDDLEALVAAGSFVPDSIAIVRPLLR